MEQKIPKVLIFGQPFNNFSGGGITLTNLFKGWPKDKIAVTYIGHGLMNVTTDICDTYYQLGREEHKWIFPFNLFQRKFPSGLKHFDNVKNLPLNYIQKSLRYKLVNRYFYPLLRLFGLFHITSTIKISKKLGEWLVKFKPQIIYLQVSTREEINFAKDLLEFLKIPSVIHVMDDWPSTINNNNLLKKFWSKRIDNEYKELLNKVDLFLSISDAMSVEYSKRYNIEFKAFHNPIETSRWLPFTKTDFGFDRDYIYILYSGRIGIGIKESLFEIAEALISLNKDGLKIKLHIQTPTNTKDLINQFQKYDCVVLNPFVSLDELPRTFSEADILLLANDFSRNAIDYLRYSMPTKVSEYMISGTPILIYSSTETAVTQFFMINKCGYCVTKQDQEEIKKAIRYISQNEEFRKRISQNAVKFAKERFDASKVRKEFQELIVHLYKPGNYVQ